MPSKRILVKRARRSRAPRLLLQPPQISTHPIYSAVFRFAATAGVGYTINVANLIGVCGAVCSVANTTLQPIARAVRLKKVEMWAPQTAVGAATSILLSWSSNATYFSPTTEITDTCLSTAQPAHLLAVPPAEASASMWHEDSGTDDLFTIFGPTGSVVDVHLNFVLNDTGAVSSIPVTVVTGVLGALYYLPLEGVATHILYPVGRVSTF